MVTKLLWPQQMGSRYWRQDRKPLAVIIAVSWPMCGGEGGGRSTSKERTLTLYPLKLGAPKSHGEIERDEMLVVAHGHDEVKFHFSQNLWRRTHKNTCASDKGKKRKHVCLFVFNQICSDKVIGTVHTVDVRTAEKKQQHTTPFMWQTHEN